MKRIKIIFPRLLNNILLAVGMLTFFLVSIPSVHAQPLAGGTLDLTTIDKYVTPLVNPPTMPRSPIPAMMGNKNKITVKGGKNIDYYEIAMRQFRQRILPDSFYNGLADPAQIQGTLVWSYGSINHPATFNYPAFTIEAKYNKPIRVKWINDLKDATGNYLPHLFAVDQTLHWANPPGPRDMRGTDPSPYTGPVPMVTHVHGAHTTDDSDGYTEAWYLPAANNIPSGYFTKGSWYNTFKAKFEARNLQTWDPGTAVFQYPNDQRASTLWYHDHTLGMTRLNVYAGPAGFYIIRGGPDDTVVGVLPGPAPALGDPPGMSYYEIPIAVQDRSFNADGSLFYPDNRAFFEGLEPAQLQIPFFPDFNPLNGLQSDVAAIWNPEFFGNTMVINGKTWPVLNVEPRRYRFRLLNGCDSRFLILKMVTGDPTSRPGVPELPFWQIGSEGGFLPAPVELNELLIGLAERADVIVDFTGLPVGTEVFLINEGPDEPFGGGIAGVDFPYSDPGTTGQVMKFVVGALMGTDVSTDPAILGLPAIAPLGAASTVRQISLNEEDSKSIFVSEDGNGNIVLDPFGEPFGPTEALLGTVDLTDPSNPIGIPLKWMDDITENPAVGATEVWEIYNFTMDAHPIHIHLVMFEVMDRQPFGGASRPPESWETGLKDTVIAYPGEITRIKARFDLAGLYVWHCHILEHEDNEMMRPYAVGTIPTPTM